MPSIKNKKNFTTTDYDQQWSLSTCLLYFQADLSKVYFIPKVIIEDRVDGCCPGRLEATEIRLGLRDYSTNAVDLNPLCFFQSVPPTSLSVEYKCQNGPMKSRFVLMRKTGGTTRPGEHSPNVFQIRELRVFVVER